MIVLFGDWRMREFIRFNHKLHALLLNKFLVWTRSRDILICGNHVSHYHLYSRAHFILGKKMPKDRPNGAGDIGIELKNKLCIKDWSSNDLKVQTPDHLKDEILYTLDCEDFTLLH